jgi:hypothetical protein
LEKNTKIAYSSTKAKYTKKFIFKVLEARTLTKEAVEDTDNSNETKKTKITPFLTPQQLEFSLFLVTDHLSNDIPFSKYYYYDNLIALAFKFASKTDYRQHRSKKSKNTPNEQFIQKALKKLDSIGLIHYEFNRKRLSKNTKEEYEATGKTNRKGIRIKFLDFRSSKTVPELYQETKEILEFDC